MNEIEITILLLLFSMIVLIIILASVREPHDNSNDHHSPTPPQPAPNGNGPLVLKLCHDWRDQDITIIPWDMVSCLRYKVGEEKIEVRIRDANGEYSPITYQARSYDIKPAVKCGDFLWKEELEPTTDASKNL